MYVHPPGGGEYATLAWATLTAALSSKTKEIKQIGFLYIMVLLHKKVKIPVAQLHAKTFYSFQ
jgi:hypothetical protein